MARTYRGPLGCVSARQAAEVLKGEGLITSTTTLLTAIRRGVVPARRHSTHARIWWMGSEELAAARKYFGQTLSQRARAGVQRGVPEGFYTIRELAELAGRPYGTVKHIVGRGKLPSEPHPEYRGWLRLVPKKEGDEFIAENRGVKGRTQLFVVAARYGIKPNYLAQFAARRRMGIKVGRSRWLSDAEIRTCLLGIDSGPFRREMASLGQAADFIGVDPKTLRKKVEKTAVTDLVTGEKLPTEIPFWEVDGEYFLPWKLVKEHGREWLERAKRAPADMNLRQMILEAGKAARATGEPEDHRLVSELSAALLNGRVPKAVAIVRKGRYGPGFEDNSRHLVLTLRGLLALQRLLSMEALEAGRRAGERQNARQAIRLQNHFASLVLARNRTEAALYRLLDWMPRAMRRMLSTQERDLNAVHRNLHALLREDVI
jgi:hypothetical protein